MSKKVMLVELMGKKIAMEISPEMTGLDINRHVANILELSLDMVKVIINRKSVLTLDTAFSSIKEWYPELQDNDKLYVVLRLGGPQPEERAVFELAKLPVTDLVKWDFVTLKKMLDKQDDVECPICFEYCINRFATCYHWACESCWEKLLPKCPFCRRENIVML